jgi:hypothetical protein
MSDQQMQGVVVLSLGIAALISSAGAAWAMSRLSRTGPVAGGWLLSTAGVVLLLVGLVLSYFGVLAIVEGAR